MLSDHLKGLLRKALRDNSALTLTAPEVRELASEVAVYAEEWPTTQITEPAIVGADPGIEVGGTSGYPL